MLNLAAAVALPVFLLSLVILALRGSLVSSSPIVVACQLFAVALMIWARTAFPKGSFSVSAKPAGSATIQRGPYRYIRHPMYTASVLLVWSSIAGHPSTVNVLIGLVPTAIVLAKIIAEERYLRARYPDYANYARSTKRMIPLVF